MPADFHHIRSAIPRLSSQRYTAWMKTLASSAMYDAHDPVPFRLKVIEHARDYGWKSAIAAFEIGKSTLYDWKKRYYTGKPQSLIPTSTRPKKVRVMQTNPLISAFIKSIRLGDYPMSKYKIKPLLDAYCLNLGVKSLATSTIGKIISRNHWFPARKIKRCNRRKCRGIRRRFAPKAFHPGHIEMDSITLWVLGRRWCFMSVIDVATRYGYCAVVNTVNSLEAIRVFIEFNHGFSYSITIVQTDNGSEFLGVFHDYLINRGISHEFIYPRSPKINGIVERFNRTVQEEFIERSDEIYHDNDKFIRKLSDYLIWYNTGRPHMALHLQTPLQVLSQFTSSIPKCP
jgi:transposase InsO family protein